jgi:hypothetical protein
MVSICFDINTQYAIVLLRLRLSLEAAPYCIHDGAVDRTFLWKFNRNTAAALPVLDATETSRGIASRM